MRARLAAFALALILAWSVQTGAQTVVTGTGHPDWPPYSWQQGKTLVGFGPELAELVCTELGLKLQLAPAGNWKRAQAEAAAGHIDLIVAIYRNEERQRYLLFPATPLADDANVIWVAKGKEFPFARWEDLIGKHGTAMLGESYGEQFDRFLRDRLNMEWVNTPRQNLQKLAMGRADFYPFSLYGGEIQVRQLGYAGKIEHLAQRISTEGVYLGVTRGSALAGRLAQIEAIVQRLREDGTLERLLRKNVELAAQATAPH